MNYFDLLDKPYKDGERGPDKYDCYGLVMEMYQRSGVTIPNYPTMDTPEANAIALLSAAENEWVKLPGAAARCAVTLLMPPDHVHIGFMLDRFEFIHTLRGRGVGVDDIRDPQWKKRITGFYQWSGAK